MRHSNGEWDALGNKEKCLSTYQFIKTGLAVHLCYLQAKALLVRIEHIKDICNNSIEKQQCSIS